MKQTTPSNSDTYRVLSRPPCRQAGSPTKTRQIALEASAMRPPRRLSRAPVAHAMIEHHTTGREFCLQRMGFRALRRFVRTRGRGMPIHRLENRPKRFLSILE